MCRFQQQLKGNPALANKWEAKREDVQQRVSQSVSVCMLGLNDALQADVLVSLEPGVWH